MFEQFVAEGKEDASISYRLTYDVYANMNERTRYWNRARRVLSRPSAVAHMRTTRASLFSSCGPGVAFGSFSMGGCDAFGSSNNNRKVTNPQTTKWRRVRIAKLIEFLHSGLTATFATSLSSGMVLFVAAAARLCTPAGEYIDALKSKLSSLVGLSRAASMEEEPLKLAGVKNRLNRRQTLLGLYRGADPGTHATYFSSSG